MKLVLKIIVFFLIGFSSKANDGSYTMSGNQLIPTIETDVSVAKERLKITRLPTTNQIEVDVYYEFLNPGEAKKIIVGFEAFGAEGDTRSHPKNGEHPYMDNFTVHVNGNPLSYQVAIVKDSTFYENGIVNTLTKAQIDYELEDSPDYPDFYYVYYFEVEFKPGTTTIAHNYKFQHSSSVVTNYEFDYVLTAANRWGNKGIDDFELEISPGIFQDLDIDPRFFDGPQDWKIKGKGVGYTTTSEYPVTRFSLQHGSIIFSKKNFKPAGELFFFSSSVIRNSYLSDVFDSKTETLPFGISYYNIPIEAADEAAFKILRNLPYARRGYVFKTQEIKKFYESMPWYVPDPNYVARLDHLLPQEQSWLQEVKKKNTF